MTGKIFISYSTQDKKIADKVIGYLESQEFTCWVAPRDISPGMDWAESIIDGIDSASLMILIVSNRSNKSPQVRREVERAVSMGVTIIPLIIEKIELSKWMQYYVSAHQWIDASSVPIEDVFPALEDSIQAVSVKEIGGIEGAKKLAGKMIQSFSSSEGNTAIGSEPLVSSESFPSRIEQEQDESRTNKQNSTKLDSKTRNLRMHVSDIKSGLVGFLSGTIFMLVARLYSWVYLIRVNDGAREYYESSGGSITRALLFEILPACYFEIVIYAFLCGFTAIAIARTLMSNQPKKLFLLSTTASFLVICSIAFIWVSVEHTALQRMSLLEEVAPYILLASCASGLLISFINRLVRKIPGDSYNDRN